MLHSPRSRGEARPARDSTLVWSRPALWISVSRCEARKQVNPPISTERRWLQERGTYVTVSKNVDPGPTTVLTIVSSTEVVNDCVIVAVVALGVIVLKIVVKPVDCVAVSFGAPPDGSTTMVPGRFEMGMVISPSLIVTVMIPPPVDVTGAEVSVLLGRGVAVAVSVMFEVEDAVANVPVSDVLSVSVDVALTESVMLVLVAVAVSVGVSVADAMDSLEESVIEVDTPASLVVSGAVADEIDTPAGSVVEGAASLDVSVDDAGAELAALVGASVEVLAEDTTLVASSGGVSRAKGEAKWDAMDLATSGTDGSWSDSTCYVKVQGGTANVHTSLWPIPKISRLFNELRRIRELV